MDDLEDLDRSLRERLDAIGIRDIVAGASPSQAAVGTLAYLDAVAASAPAPVE